jgi:hypothetical protein
VDIPADDAFPQLRHRRKLYQTTAGRDTKCSAAGRIRWIGNSFGRIIR